MKSSKAKLERRLIMFMSFFIFGGYQAGLGLILSSGFIVLSKLYTVPLRVSGLLITGYYIKRYRRYIINSADRWLILFCMLYFFKALYTANLNPSNLSKPWYSFVFFLLLFGITIYFFFRSIPVKKYMDLIVRSVVFSGFVLAFVVIVFYRDVLFSSGVGRFGATTETEGDMVILSPLAIAYTGALNVSLLIPYIVQSFERGSGKSLVFKLYLMANFCLSMFVFVLGSTRGALLAVLLSVVLFVVGSKGFSKVKYMLLSLLMIPVFLIYLDYTGSSLLSRTQTTVDSRDFGRGELWIEAWNEFAGNPIFGGLLEVSGQYPHNIVLEILMATGIAGFMAFFCFVLSSVYKVPIKQNVFAYIVLANALAQHMFTGAVYTAVILFFALGLINGSKNNYE